MGIAILIGRNDLEGGCDGSMSGGDNDFYTLFLTAKQQLRIVRWHVSNEALVYLATSDGIILFSASYISESLYPVVHLSLSLPYFKS
jgi:hypothetical protein